MNVRKGAKGDGGGGAPAGEIWGTPPTIGIPKKVVVQPFEFPLLEPDEFNIPRRKLVSSLNSSVALFDCVDMAEIVFISTMANVKTETRTKAMQISTSVKPAVDKEWISECSKLEEWIGQPTLIRYYPWSHEAPFWTNSANLA
jgi:hypothetical protein